MPNRLFYTVKLTSSLLKEYKYDLNISFENCLRSGLIVSLADSQMLLSIRDITGQVVDREILESWYSERDTIKKRKNTKDNRNRLKELQNNIYNMMYIPEYITVVMENIKDYERMFKKGFKFNGKTYRRFSCSASQARVSTIVFVDETIKDELKRRLDNGRDLNKPLAPSKYNAYFGLYSSAIKPVTKPRFCVVPDYNSFKTVDVDFVIEKGKDEDDVIEPRTMDIEFNRFDGSGLISPQMAEQWGRDLGEDYTPCQFCLRYAFTKGMVQIFDFVEWCKEENNGNYMITDIYGEQRDLREIDVILSEGQVKLYSSWSSQEELERNSEENGIVFGVTKYSPKHDKNMVQMNYQFLQTLNLDDDMIKDFCQDTVDYIQGVSYDDVYYSLLFMLGENSNEDSIQKFMRSSDNYWLKSLILNHNLLNDKYSKEKIRDMIVRRIELACLGKINCQGNFNVICPDPYGFMQWITGHQVTGLLGDGEFYNNYWAIREKDVIACGRSPMTHFSEWLIVKNKYKLDSQYLEEDLLDVMDLDCSKVLDYISDEKRTEKIKKYYKYAYSGTITNIHGHYTMNMSGSDFDMDILFSASNNNIIKGKYKKQRVVTYAAKKPHKKLFTEEDLFFTDTFSFGTQIGQITNTCSTICGLIPIFPEGSKERQILEDRLKAGCAAQSRQIDKTKIGENVKTLGTVCKQFQRAKDGDSTEEIARKNFYNTILADKKPYFFRYKYRQLNKELNEYNRNAETTCQTRFYMSFKELVELPEEKRTQQQKDFLFYYYKFLPVLDSSCVMNKVCHYIESIDFEIKKKVRSSDGFDWHILTSENFQPEKALTEKLYNVIVEEMSKKHLDLRSLKLSNPELVRKNSITQKDEFDKETWINLLRSNLEDICSNEEKLANHLVYIFYEVKSSLNKSVLWGVAGKAIYENIKNKTNVFYFPIKNQNGSIKFLYENYSIEKIELNDLKEENNG